MHIVQHLTTHLSHYSNGLLCLYCNVYSFHDFKFRVRKKNIAKIRPIYAIAYITFILLKEFCVKDIKNITVYIFQSDPIVATVLDQLEIIHKSQNFQSEEKRGDFF